MNTYPNPSWFDITARENFERFLPNHLARTIIHSSKSLQLGVFTGDASIWLMENTDTDLIDVDTWQGSGDEPGVISEFDFDEVREYYLNRTHEYTVGVNKGRITTMITDTQDFLKEFIMGELAIPMTLFDFIYVDGDHTAKGVLEDAVNSYPLLKVGGLIAFDDYTWRCGDMLREPWMAIDMFQCIYRDKFEVLAKNAQYWMRKIA